MNNIISLPGAEIERVPTHDEADRDLALRAVNVLTSHYPGYLWRVGINDEEGGGIMYIINVNVNAQFLKPSDYGYTLHLKTVYADPGLKCVMMAGGAILESAGLSRIRNKDEWITAIDGVDHIKYPLDPNRMERL